MQREIKLLKMTIKDFDQLMGVRSTCKLVKIHNSYLQKTPNFLISWNWPLGSGESSLVLLKTSRATGSLRFFKNSIQYCSWKFDKVTLELEVFAQILTVLGRGSSKRVWAYFIIITMITYNGMLRHSLGGAVILCSLQHFILPCLTYCSACKPDVGGRQ